MSENVRVDEEQGEDKKVGGEAKVEEESNQRDRCAGRVDWIGSRLRVK